MVDINKYIHSPKENIFHSSGIARVGSGGLGSTSAESFDRRRYINRGRQTVRAYGHSMIGRGNMHELARPHMEAGSSLRQADPADMSSRRPPTTAPTPQRTFKEPPTRGYNPYG